MNTYSDQMFQCYHSPVYLEENMKKSRNKKFLSSSLQFKVVFFKEVNLFSVLYNRCMKDRLQINMQYQYIVQNVYIKGKYLSITGIMVLINKL